MLNNAEGTSRWATSVAGRPEFGQSDTATRRRWHRRRPSGHRQPRRTASRDRNPEAIKRRLDQEADMPRPAKGGATS
jgi:hypothetical protein